MRQVQLGTRVEVHIDADWRGNPCRRETGTVTRLGERFVEVKLDNGQRVLPELRNVRPV